MEALRHILVGTDFSEASDAAFETGAALSRALDARLTLLHVSSPGVQALGAAGREEGLARGHDVHEALARLRSRMPGLPKFHVEVLTDASPAAAIVDYAAASDVDLVIVGSHGHGAAKRFLLGSIADRVARHARCSVLVARAAE